MSRHEYYAGNGREGEMHIMNAKTPAVNRGESKHQSQQKGGLANQDAMDEERQEVATTPKQPRSNRISAMRLKFEQASSTSYAREPPPAKQKVPCGSGVAERKKQLQQLFLAKEETPPPNRDSFQKANSVYQELKKDKSNSSRRLAEFLKRKNEASKISEKKEMFENAVRRYDSRSEANSKASVPDPASPDPEPTFAMTISDSEFSPLEYDGSLFSEDYTITARDEAEAPRPFDEADCREGENTEDVRNNDEQIRNRTLRSSLSPTNSFQDALQDIVDSFEKCTSAQLQKRTDEVSNRHSVQVNDEQTYSPHRTFVMDTERIEEPSPVSLLTSFETDPSGHLSSRESSINADDAALTLKPFSTKHSTRDLSRLQHIADSALFSTVNQEEEKRKVTENFRAQREVHVTQKAEEMAVHVATESTATQPPSGSSSSGSTEKDEMSDETEKQDNKPIKGILKNKNQEPTSPVFSSVSSWYSSVTSGANSEQLSPLQTPRMLSMPMLQTGRLSIGACITAHLAEHPPLSPYSEASSQGSGFRHLDYPATSSDLMNRDLGLPYRLERHNSDGSSLAALRDRATSPATTVEDQIHTDSKRSNQDFKDLADAMSNMANTASNVVLDALVEAADKVVVTPLISIFNCVDASEGLFCQGESSAVLDLNGDRHRKVRRGRLRKRTFPKSSSRKFNA